MTTRGVGRTCWACAATLGGGLVGGDAIRMSIDAAEGTSVVLSTQASTKVYRSLSPASQQIHATIADGATLAVLPDPVVCFADADFSQEQTYDLAPHANLVLVDWVTSGRHAIGERWAFRRYANRIEIQRAGRRVAYDATVMAASDGPIAERWGHYDVALTAVITGPRLAGQALEIVRRLSERPVERRSPLVLSAWGLCDGGALLRVAGVSAEQVGSALRDQFSFLENLLGGDPWIGKW